MVVMSVSRIGRRFVIIDLNCISIRPPTWRISLVVMTMFRVLIVVLIMMMSFHTLVVVVRVVIITKNSHQDKEDTDRRSNEEPLAEATRLRGLTIEAGVCYILCHALQSMR